MTEPMQPPQDPDRPSDPAPTRDDVERGLRFLHTLAMQSKVDLVDLSARLLALIEELVASRTLDLRAFEARRETVAARDAERMTKEGHVRVMVDETEDKYALTDLPEIDCAARFPLCRARCCGFGFSLSFQDLNERIVEWDYGMPYHIRQGEHGFCVHSDRASGRCAVYANRPAVCRNYDCRNDSRIWKDFEARIPADQQASDEAD